ncbi:asparagine synthase-related protein [Paenibacillus aurantiacus]|uniref:asparagine synthase (glutamine-hydrolyzing) n=1 Tax=Paenibacillus aurantiacus TaxID=1936118 RepID=A0ABV5L0H6_9BACL
MSIVAGVYNYDHVSVSDDIKHHILQALSKSTADAVGTWQQDGVFLACRNQTPTSSSPHEQLPSCDEPSRTAITADAVIDNRGELCGMLGLSRADEARLSDSELIRLAYVKWGEECPRYLAGDFAFVIWDAGKRTLFGARDLLGSRTLYYQRRFGRFAFCSFLNPLSSLPDFQRRLSDAWLSHFLAIPSMVESTDPSATVYSDIFQLPPGHSIRVHDGNVEVRSYGSLIPQDMLRLNGESEYLEAFNELFRQAVESRARTDKGVGVALSGGLDSTAVASVAAEYLRGQGRSLRGYSMIPAPGFADWTSANEMADETPFVQATIDHVGNIEGTYLNAAGKSPFTEIDELLGIFEAPYKNFEGTFRIKDIYSQASNDGVGVLLTGARGNYTISWGSAIDYYALLLKRWQWIRFYRELTMFRKQTRVGINRIMPVIGRQAFSFLQSNEPEPEPPRLIHPDFARRTGVWESLRPDEAGFGKSKNDVLQERQNYFANSAVLHLQGAVGSKLSAKYRVWERDPTADARLIRFCLSVPFEQYVVGGIGRSMIRRAMTGRLPDQVRLNQRIRGAQGVDWVYRLTPHWTEFTDEVKRICADSAVAGLLNQQQLRTSLTNVGASPRPELAGDEDMKLLMRSVIFYRFIKQFH